MSRRGWAPIASGAQVAALVCGTVTNLLYARLLAPAEIGRLALFLALAAGLVLLADAGLQLLVTRELSRGTLEPEAALTVLLKVLPLLGGLWSLALFGASRLLGTVWSPLEISVGSALLVVELAGALLLFQVALTLHQGLSSFSRRSLLLFGNGLATAVLTAAALAPVPSVASAVHATAVAYAVTGAAGIWPLCRRYRFAAIPARRVARLMRRAVPLWLNSAVTFTTSSADVLLAAVLLPLSAVGYYQILKKLSLAVLAPLTTLLPLLYAQLARLSDAGRAHAYRRVQRLAAGLVAGSLVAGAPFLPFVVRATFGPRVAALSIPLVALIAVGGLQFSHNLLGYFLTAGGFFNPPLLVNGAVAVSALLLAPALGGAYGLRGFIGALAGANALGLVLATALAARRSSVALFPVVLQSTSVLAALVLVSIGLLALPPATALPIGLLLGVGVIGLVLAADRRGPSLQPSPRPLAETP